VILRRFQSPLLLPVSLFLNFYCEVFISRSHAGSDSANCTDLTEYGVEKWTSVLPTRNPLGLFVSEIIYKNVFGLTDQGRRITERDKLHNNNNNNNNNSVKANVIPVIIGGQWNHFKITHTVPEQLTGMPKN